LTRSGQENWLDGDWASIVAEAVSLEEQ